MLFDDVMEDEIMLMLLTEVVEDFFTVVDELIVFVELELIDFVDDTDLDTWEDEEKEEEEVVWTEEDPTS